VRHIYVIDLDAQLQPILVCKSTFFNLIIRPLKACSCSVRFSLGKIRVMDEDEHVQNSGLPAIADED
jgi:hypothetical protein